MPVVPPLLWARNLHLLKARFLGLGTTSPIRSAHVASRVHILPKNQHYEMETSQPDSGLMGSFLNESPILL